MHGLPAADGSRRIEWGRCSADYADWRPNYPPEFFRRLLGLGIGRSGQRILDLGTGVGHLALEFARQGARVTGVDISPEQIETARSRARERGVDVDFQVLPAEATGLPEAEFDVVTASQCWLYFDSRRVLSEVRRVLAPRGRLVLAHLCWLPREDSIAQASEELVLHFNPDWSAADWSGEIPDVPASLRGEVQKLGGFVFDVDLPFTRVSWRGRMRACRGVGATLTGDELARFDSAHAALLEEVAPEAFTVRHRIDAFVCDPSVPV